MPSEGVTDGELIYMKACNTTADCQQEELVTAMARASDGDMYVCDTTMGHCALPGNETCGSTFCPDGQLCCNESCEICAPVGGVCTQQYCGVPDDDMPTNSSIDPEEAENESLSPSNSTRVRIYGSIAVLVFSMLFV
jgi:hypothetical protein